MRNKTKFGCKMVVVAVAASIFIAVPASANVGTGMNQMFNSVGGFANATPPSSYKGQTMNGFSGGGLYIRTPVSSAPLANMTAPSLNIGCGGIDLTAGSFSFINQAALTGLLKNVGTSITYAFLLAIQSSMPQMADLFKYLQDVANKVNSSQINACQLTSGIPFKKDGSLSENFSAVTTHITGAVKNIYTDFEASRDATKSDVAARNNVANAAIAADPTQAEVFRPGNVVWRILSRRSGLDQGDKEFIMSMTGTVIVEEPTGTGATSTAKRWISKPRKIFSVDDLVGPTPTGGISVYKCDADITENGCLTPTEQTIPVTSFFKMVSDKIDLLRKMVTDRKPQNVADFRLLDASSVPIWKMIAASANYNPGLVENYKRMVAVDVAYEYINNILIQARQIMQSGQSEAKAEDAQAALTQLKDNLEQLNKDIMAQRLIEAANVQKQIEVERQLQMLMQAMNSGIPSQAFTSMQVFN